MDRVKRAWLLLGACLLVACGGSAICGGAGGSVGNNGWVLEGDSPDGRHLLVSTWTAAVFSGQVSLRCFDPVFPRLSRL